MLSKILTRYERDYERDRPGLVRDALALLWAARRGLTEPESWEVLSPPDEKCLPTALWSPVRYALEDGLVDRDGVLAFGHEHLRLAVERRYVPDAGAAQRFRLRLADHFTSEPVDARQADELPWLLRQASLAIAPNVSPKHRPFPSDSEPRRGRTTGLLGLAQ